MEGIGDLCKGEIKWGIIEYKLQEERNENMEGGEGKENKW